MTKTNTSRLRRFGAVLGSTTFFRAVVILLVLQAAWIALSGRYPMAFDEDFHLGIIKLYAHHLSPFWSSQPPNSDMFGALTRDPSYLYQYLMSFPYRLISLFSHDQTIQVLWLRAINISLFVWGVTLYRRLLLKTGASKSIIHVCLLIFILLPTVPLLAAQINYDNLFLPVVALALLLVVKCDEHISRQQRLDAGSLAQLLIVCLLASLVKYAFLPIFLVVICFIIVRIWQYRHKLKIRLSLTASWQRLSVWLKLSLIILLVMASVLFGERYGVNLIRYHEPLPDCAQVLSTKRCSAYGPWIRDYNYKINKLDTDAEKSPLTFTADWFYGMWLRTFFAVDGPLTDYQTRGPLPIPSISAIVFAVMAAVAVIIAARRLLKLYRAPLLWLFIAAAVGYCGALWFDEYGAFVQTGQPVAINGRYLLPILPLLLLISALAFGELSKHRPRFKLGLASLAVVSLVWGGGALTYILRSTDIWYWPNPAVRSVNHFVKDVAGPITPGYNDPAEFLH